jgi:hypothetical protein
MKTFVKTPNYGNAWSESKETDQFVAAACWYNRRMDSDLRGISMRFVVYREPDGFAWVSVISAVIMGKEPGGDHLPPQA